MGKRIFLALLSVMVYSSISLAAGEIPPHPGYANCPTIQVRNGGTEEEPIMKTQVEPGCANTVNRNHNALVDATNRANRITTADNNGMVAPVHPGPNTCPTISGENGQYVDPVCDNAYRQKMFDFSLQDTAHKTVLAQQAEIARQQTAAAATRASGSSTNLLSDIEKKNNEAAAKQKTFQTAFMIASAGFAVKFAISCSGAGATCQYGWLAASIAAGVSGMMSGKQASNHASMGMDACKSYNSIASSGKPCGTDVQTTPEDPNNPVFPNQVIDPGTGLCRANAPASCKTDRDRFIAERPLDIKLLKPGPSGFPGPGKLYKINKDGTITANGKTYKASDFANEKSMIAAGFSPKDAAMASSAMFGKDGVATKLGKSVASDLKNSKFELGSMGADGAGGGTVTIKTGEGSTDAGGLGSKDMDGLGGAGKRDLASEEGLVKDFNGDSIGISNDDIFKMMNKRYILKSAQDTFIGQ